MAEQRTFNPLVVGSTPTRPTQPDQVIYPNDHASAGSRPRPWGPMWNHLFHSHPPRSNSPSAVKPRAARSGWRLPGTRDRNACGLHRTRKHRPWVPRNQKMLPLGALRPLGPPLCAPGPDPFGPRKPRSSQTIPPRAAHKRKVPCLFAGQQHEGGGTKRIATEATRDYERSAVTSCYQPPESPP
jgi:hypothetical protein